MTIITSGHTVFKKGRFELYRLKNGYRFGLHKCFEMEIYNPESEKEILSIGLIWFELNIVLKGGI